MHKHPLLFPFAQMHMHTHLILLASLHKVNFIPVKTIAHCLHKEMFNMVASFKRMVIVVIRVVYLKIKSYLIITGCFAVSYLLLHVEYEIIKIWLVYFISNI